MTESTHSIAGARATYAGQRRTPRLAALIESLRAIIASDRFRVALQAGLALVLAYGIALAMDWPKPQWAGLAIAMCSPSTVGESLHKGMQRVFGTLLAVPIALVLVSLFPQDRWAFFATVGLWTGVCAYLSGSSARGYFWYVAGFSVPLLAIMGNTEPPVTFNIVILRFQEAMLGVLVFFLVSLLILPVSSLRSLRSNAAQVVASQRTIVRKTLSLLGAAGEAADRGHLRGLGEPPRMASRAGRPEGLGPFPVSVAARPDGAGRH
jgi:uncharacterized membrane protein YgaE (UPF0421/DUF939 family)